MFSNRAPDWPTYILKVKLGSQYVNRPCKWAKVGHEKPCDLQPLIHCIIAHSVNKQCCRFTNTHLGTYTMEFSLLYWSSYCLQFNKLQKKSGQAVLGDRVGKITYDSECKVLQASLACVLASIIHEGLQLQSAGKFNLIKLSCSIAIILHW